MTQPIRKITQFAVGNCHVYALCNDGTLLVRRDELVSDRRGPELGGQDWFELPPIPQPEPINFRELP